MACSFISTALIYKNFVKSIQKNSSGKTNINFMNIRCFSIDGKKEVKELGNLKKNQNKKIPDYDLEAQPKENLINPKLLNIPINIKKISKENIIK